MLKKTIAYTDFNDKPRVEDFYFNLTTAEVIEMELSQSGGLVKRIEEIVASEDNAEIVAMFKSLILDSHGVKSEDGRKFIKTQAVRDSFAQTQAYSALFMELATDAGAAASFVNGVIPQSGKALAAEIAE